MAVPSLGVQRQVEGRWPAPGLPNSSPPPAASFSLATPGMDYAWQAFPLVNHCCPRRALGRHLRTGPWWARRYQLVELGAWEALIG